MQNMTSILILRWKGASSSEQDNSCATEAAVGRIACALISSLQSQHWLNSVSTAEETHKHVRLELRHARMIWARRRTWQLSAGIMRILTASGLFLALCSIGLLIMAISTDYWYETDARKHRDRCKKYASKRNNPGYIYISNQNLPLRMRPEPGAALRESLHPEPVLESRCSRHYNSTTTGLWKKCHREGFDLENEDLIFKGDVAYQTNEIVLSSSWFCKFIGFQKDGWERWRYPRCWSVTSTITAHSHLLNNQIKAKTLLTQIVFGGIKVVDLD